MNLIHQQKIDTLGLDIGNIRGEGYYSCVNKKDTPHQCNNLSLLKTCHKLTSYSIVFICTVT